MALKFSKNQQEAIDSCGQNIIVSAGAGSGKTAVLTARIKRILHSGVKANELLVLTFTNAAAAEMKERITKAMANDEILKERTFEVDNAYITTFDSFSLSIVSKYHDRLNLSSNISIIDNSILNVQKRKIIDDIFLKHYLSKNEKFANLMVDLTNKDDASLRKEVLNIANKLDQNTSRDTYLDEYVSKYFIDKAINKYIAELTKLLNEKITFIKEKVSEIEGFIKEDLFTKLIESTQQLLVSKNYDQIKIVVSCIKLPIFRKVSEEAKRIKDDIKSTIDDIVALCPFENEKAIKNAYYQSKQYVEVLIEILKEYYQRIDEYKKSHEVFEFIDISKMAISLVKDNKDIREELKNHFKEILIDEYQDTNDIQEEFISYIANNNVYMVGDIKQSIYGFRNANPLIFKNKYDAYRVNKGGKKIDLTQNFRSNRPVLDIINDIFDRIMDDDIGQANFKAEHRMQFGLSDYDNNSQDNKIKYVTYIENKGEYRNSDVDMFFVLKDILRKIENKEQVYDKDSGKFRDCEYKDFAILLADSKLFDPMSRLLAYNHIPNLIFKNIEVNDGEIIILLKNIIKLIALDNQKTYDSEFLRLFYGIGRSFIIKYSDEQLFDMITNNDYQNTDFYQKINEYSQKVDNTSLSDLFDEIIKDFNIFEKLVEIGNIEDNITRIEFFAKTIKSMESLDINIFDFVKYIDDIFENGDKMELPSSGLNENKVRIMTIHKSKGLEFPIVYFINNDKKFNKKENKDKFIYDNVYGFITPYCINGEGKNINFLLMKDQNNKSLISEKIRLLYVALTRAREQIIILNPSDEKSEYYEYNLVPTVIRKKYNSFKHIYDSIGVSFKNCTDMIQQIDDLNISDDYLKTKNKDLLDLIDKTQDTISFVENNIDSYEVEDVHASKSEISLKSKENIQVMEFGSNMHEIFESFDFINQDFSSYSAEEKNLLHNFLNQTIMKDVKNGIVYKEFEFMYETNGKNMHGIIDLMIEYDSHIDIIDYKLSHIEDEAYLKQLNAYKEYVESKTSKKVDLYLYSIMKNDLKKINI